MTESSGTSNAVGALDVDTIAAISTAPGVSAIAVVRVSGPDAVSLVEAITEDGRLPAPRRPGLLRLVDPDERDVLDQALVTVFPGPGSYTGEDLVELSCHGGWLVPELVLQALLAVGARRAEAGEFSRRAYLRGKLDLVQVEAVADVTTARSRAMHRAAIGQLERGLSRRVAELREALVGVEALLAHHIDFPEEDDPPVPAARVRERAESLVARVDELLATAPEGELLREGALAVLAGRPNVGKSSLYNALLGRERAIVTEEPGTTRDALEEGVQLGGFPFRLVDTAGLRDADESIERIGVEVTRRYLADADVVVFCSEAGSQPSDEELGFLAEVGDVPVLWVETKADLVIDGTPSGAPMAHRVRLSVVSGEGLEDLRLSLPRLVYTGLARARVDAPVLTRARHAKALRTAREELVAFCDALAEGLPAEVAATHLRPAETALEELLGVVSVEDVLDVVFRDFCVGK